MVQKSADPFIGDERPCALRTRLFPLLAAINERTVATISKRNIRWRFAIDPLRGFNQGIEERNCVSTGKAFVQYNCGNQGITPSKARRIGSLVALLLANNGYSAR